MFWRDYFLWAGIFLGSLELAHFFHQRKLPDLRTKLLMALMILSLMLCLLSVTVTFQREHRLVTSAVAMLPVTGVYLCKIWLPYGLLAMSCVMMRRLDHIALKLGLFPAAAGSLMVISSLFTHYVSYPGADGLTYVGDGYSLYIWGVFAGYCLDLAFILYNRKAFRFGHLVGLLEMAVLNMAGILLQSIFLIQLVDGFMSVLGLSFIYQFANNPYAYIDFSTQVFNRDYFNHWMWERREKGRKTFLVGIYLPDMENIQNVYGKNYDIRLLKTVAEQLWKAAPRHEIFRFRHNQFVICTNQPEEQEALILQVSRIFDREYQVEESRPSSLAVIARFQERDEFYDTETLQSYMDHLFRSCRNRERIQMIADDDEKHDRYIYGKKVESFLEEAIAKDLFEVWYQPIYSSAEKRFTELEALSRLKHPELGWVFPEIFVRTAMEKGLIFQIMPLQVAKICRFLKEYEEDLKNIRKININLSAPELADTAYMDRLTALIQSWEISLEKIRFEVTESFDVYYTEEMEQYIRELGKKGLQICMDDFGTGYSNVGALLQIPFSDIKIDRSLLQNVCSDGDAAVLYQNIVATFRTLGYDVIAEGVETREEAELLTQWGVDKRQGYYYARPQTAEETVRMLGRRGGEERMR